jgi:DNA mismatch repair protein MutS
MHKWAGRLTSVGWTVIIVDQVKDAKGKVKERKVARILSPSTHIENISANETAYVATLFMEQQPMVAPLFGVEIIDLTTGKTMTYSGQTSGLPALWTADDVTQLFQVYQPKELVVYWKGTQHADEHTFRKLILTAAPIHVRQLDTLGAFEKDLVRTEYLQKSYACKTILPIRTYLGLRTEQEELAVVYLLQFVEEHYASLIQSLQRNEPWIPHTHLICGNHALSQLQMSSENGVLSLFTKCITVMGKRGIRERLLRPYSDPQLIQNRLAEVTEYLAWPKERITSVERQLRFMYDTSRLHRKIICASVTSDEIQGLFQTYHSVENIMELIKDTRIKAPFTKETWFTYYTLFTTHFTESKPLSPFNVKTYPDIGEKEQEIQLLMEQLEVLRMDFNALVKEDAVRIEEREKEPFGFKASTLIIKQLKKCALPAGTIFNELKSGGWIDCTQLQTINRQLITRREQLQRLINTHQLDACHAITEGARQIWTEVDDWICHVDCTQCIGRVSVEHGWSCPVIRTDGLSAIDIKQIRHPLVEASSTRITYVKHNISLGQQAPGQVEENNGWLIYGMNASGKSTLMKATGICIVLAQAGCFVPAQSMELTPFRAIYTRILNQDNIHAGLSSFAVEMSELRDILRNADAYTMVLGDELCAGTESISAQALVASGIEWLVKRQSKFIFATHLHELPSLVEGVAVWHLHVEYDPVTKKLIYDRSLRPGSGSSLYGLEVARAMDLPFEFIEKALQKREQLMGATSLARASRSAWNKEIVRKECELCKAHITSELEVHHISPRASAINQRLQDGSHMNDKRNLIVICQACHDKIHAETIQLGPLQMTSDGPERSVVTVSNTVMKRTKKTDEEMETVMEMLKKYPSLALKAMRAKLSQLHGIEMSETALGKIRRAI